MISKHINSNPLNPAFIPLTVSWIVLCVTCNVPMWLRCSLINPSESLSVIEWPRLSGVWEPEMVLYRFGIISSIPLPSGRWHSHFQFHLSASSCLQMKVGSLVAVVNCLWTHSRKYISQYYNIWPKWEIWLQLSGNELNQHRLKKDRVLQEYIQLWSL